MGMVADWVVDDALLFDGSGDPARRASVAVTDGCVTQISDSPLGPGAGRAYVDARGRWLMPGFLDIHTHYDAEVEAAPALSESLRHGVTTVVFGSCSLGTVLSSPLDIADMFTRVEAVPREHVLPLFETHKTWRTPAEYRAHLDALPLGPNVTAFLGHSDLRTAVLGLERAVTRGVRPSATELGEMGRWLDDALDAGFLGLSVNTNRWDKLGGTRHRSQSLPSAFARWSEIRALTRRVRARGRVLQAIPNISAKYDLFLYYWESMGILRPRLKTTLVSIADVRSDRRLYRVLAALTRLVNGALSGDFRMQALPMPFQMYVDGLEAPIFEEIGAGTAALHLESQLERRALLRSPEYRSWFRRQWTSWIVPKVFHRDLRVSRIVACPDASLVGRSFGDVAAARGAPIVETFLDLCAEHGDALRWFTTIGNDRPAHLRAILELPDVLVGFSDAGAHLRNMAFYNFGLSLLKLALDAEREGVPFLSVPRAVHRLTREIADWLGLDAGRVEVGARADLVLVDPAGLGPEVEDETREAPIPELGGLMRMVRRNEAAVPLVWVGGRLAVRDGVPTPEAGRFPMGRFLGAGEVQRVPRQPPEPAGVEPQLQTLVAGRAGSSAPVHRP
jgi:N-acyl-D-aspartate/D-glutamate deacylase